MTAHEHTDWDAYQHAYREWHADAAAICNQMIGAQEWMAAHPREGAAADAWERYAERLAEWADRQPRYHTSPGASS